MRCCRAEVETFVYWCVEIEIEMRFPAAAKTVRRCLEEQRQSKAPSTDQRPLYTIRKVHLLLRDPDPTHNEEIDLGMRTVRRTHAVRPR